MARMSARGAQYAARLRGGRASVFPGYVKRIYDLIAWLQSKGPGGLT